MVFSSGICCFYGGDDVSIYAHTCAKWCRGGCINITKVNWRAETLLNRFTGDMLAKNDVWVWYSASACVVLTAAVAIFPSITYLYEMVCGGLWQGQKGRIMRNGLQKRVLRPLLHLRRGTMLAKSRTATRFPLQQQIAQSALCGCLYRMCVCIVHSLKIIF